MNYNPRTISLLNRSIAEYRIRKWFKTKRKKDYAPSILLTKLMKPRNAIQIYLTREERSEFVNLIREMYIVRKTIRKYRRLYSRRPGLFYKKLLGFSPRESQFVKIIWNPLNIHIIFEKGDMLSFWKKVQWGPGSGGYYPLGDTDIKIKDMRGLVSIGVEEDHSIETLDTFHHETVHAFEGAFKKRKEVYNSKTFMFNRIKSELNAYLHNFRTSKKRRKNKINLWARNGLGLEVTEFVDDYLRYEATVERIKKLKKEIGKTKVKYKKEQMKLKLKKLNQLLEKKKLRKKYYTNSYKRIKNQIRIALEVMPIEVLHRIIYETPYERLQTKIPEAVKTYRWMKYQQYRNN